MVAWKSDGQRKGRSMNLCWPGRGEQQSGAVGCSTEEVLCIGAGNGLRRQHLAQREAIVLPHNPPIATVCP